jgi:tRNA(Ile)-lysidine synthase
MGKGQQDARVRGHDGLDKIFSGVMARLGPFGAGRNFAVAVSGGADSMALALLAWEWAAHRDASVVALVVDHGLRAEAALEARLTRERLAARGIAANIIALTLSSGPKMQETARTARHEALASAAREQGCLYLLLGHHAADQAETVAMRAARGDGGLEGMAAWTARDDVVLLRPLLGIAPEELRGFLRAENVEWVEDPSNADRRFERVRVRQDGGGLAPADAGARRTAQLEAAEFLARHAVLRPEGFAVIRADAAPPAALAALLRAVGGKKYPPRRDSVAALAGKLRAATLGGVLVRESRKLGGWLLAREPAACAPPVPGHNNAIWDGRFRLQIDAPEEKFGAVGADAARFRKVSNLPSLVLQTMPCLRRGGQIRLAPVRFAPPAPVCGHPFFA